MAAASSELSDTRRASSGCSSEATRCSQISARTMHTRCVNPLQPTQHRGHKSLPTR
jgi:hypothetical protein